MTRNPMTPTHGPITGAADLLTLEMGEKYRILAAVIGELAPDGIELDCGKQPKHGIVVTDGVVHWLEHNYPPMCCGEQMRIWAIR